MVQAFYLLYSYVNRLMCAYITGFFLWGVVISSMDGSFIIVRWYVMQVITVALSRINQRTNSFSKVFVWREGNMECALQAVFLYNRSRDIWCLTKDICWINVVDGLFSYAAEMPVERLFIRQSNDPKTLFTWSGGPRSSGVGFFCFVSPERENKKKPTPLDRVPHFM